MARPPSGLALLLALLASSAAAYTPFDTVTETTHRRVTWEDFQGPALDRGRWSSGFAAHIVSEIRITRYSVELASEPDGTWVATAPEAEAYAVMDKLLSGAASVAKKDNVLAHEQLHFDLTETFARRLTPELQKAWGRGSTEELARLALRSEIERLRGEAARDLDQAQGRYDEETNHGTRKRHQKHWARQIAEWFEAAGREGG